jgi:hypothetical protein
MLVLYILFFALIIWLGFYLVVRDPANSTLRWTGFGVLLYALIFAQQIVTTGRYTWLLFVIGLVIFLLDIVLARRGIVDLGERFWPDFLRSLAASTLFALLFGAPIAITMAWVTGVTPALLNLLLITLTLAIISQVCGELLQVALDRVAFAAFPHLQQARAELRATADALPKVDPNVYPNVLDEAEFVRHTRRALSYYGDLPHLSTNPLTRLPLIDQHLATHNKADNTLERAAALKQLLLKAILRLKPTTQADFGTSEAWRYYNALYFPYVVGLKPYSRRAHHTNLDAASQQALDWLRAEVPERTLYNWQNAAAKLVARDLMENGG